MYQARRVDPTDLPKYITIAPKGRGRVTYHHFSSGSDTLVIVEDILSAIKLGRHCDTIALLGTSFHDDDLLSIGKYKRVIIYLDDDNAQVKRMQRKLKRRISYLCDDVQIYHSGGVDPKDLTDAEILEVLDATR